MAIVITQVAHSESATAATLTTAAFSPTVASGDLIVVLMLQDNAAAANPCKDNNNTNLTQVEQAADNAIATIFWEQSDGTQTTITGTQAGATALSVTVFKVTGATGWAFDVGNLLNTIGSGPKTGVTGAIAATSRAAFAAGVDDGSTAFSAVANSGTGTASPTWTFTARGVLGSMAGGEGTAIVDALSGTLEAQFTTGGSDHMSCVIAAFKGTVGGPAVRSAADSPAAPSELSTRITSVIRQPSRLLLGRLTGSPRSPADSITAFSESAAGIVGGGGVNFHLNPVAHGYPGPTNTGFDGVNAAGGPLTVGQLTPVSGTVVTTADGQVIDGLDITVGTSMPSDTGLTGIQVNHGTLANPVIIKRCRIRLRPWDPFDGVNGSGGCGMLKVAVGKYVTIQDCELFSDLGTTGCNTTSPGCCNDSTGITCTDALVHVTANRLKVHNGSGIVEHTDGITLTDCYFYNLICGCTPAPCQHSQAVACRNVNNVHLEHCFLDGRNAGTALFFVQHQSQWCQNLSMNNCLGWLDKASTYYLFQDSLQFTSCPPGGGNFVITNNRFQFDNRSPTDIQNFSFDCPGTTWSNNVWDDTGATIAAPF